MNIDIDESKFRHLDLNLLLVFSAMLRERSVTRAANALFLGQPAVSAALARLREATGDKLFVRGAGGMEPTVRALELAEQIKPALETIESAFFRPARFDPASSDRIFRIRLPDSVEVTLMPPLLQSLSEDAPGLRFSLRGVSVGQAPAELDNGTLDLAFGVFDEVPPRFRWRSLGMADFSVLYCPRQIPRTGSISLQDYLDYPHLLTSFNGDLSGVLDDVLEEAGMKRRVVLSTAQFLVMPFYLQAAPYLATMPTNVARFFAAQYGLVCCDLPIETAAFEVGLIWHSRAEGDPALRWLIDRLASQIEGILAPVTSTGPVE